MKKGKLMPGEFRQDVVHIGIECRNVLQHYYAIGGFAASFATFRAHIKEISVAKALLTALCVEFTDFNYMSIRTIKDFVDHVWIFDMEPLAKANVKKGDNIEFTALVYAYHRKDGSVDYSLKDLKDIKQIDSYGFSDEELEESKESEYKEFLQSLKCENCLAKEHCYGICIR